MASLARRHPKFAMLAVAATAFICLPFWLPLLLLTSPFLLFTSLFSMGVVTFLKCLFRLSLYMQRNLARRRLGAQYDHGSIAEDVYRTEEGSLKENRVHEYLEDQLKNLNVVALRRSESKEDLLPCSFSFGSDDLMEAFNYRLLCHDGA